MSVVAYVFGCYSSSLVELVSVFVRTRSFAETFDYFLYNIMSNQSNRSLSSCEIAGNDSSMLKSGSPEMSLFSEVICSLSFKEPTAGTSFIITGLVLTSCERFSINFLATTHKQDVALHFNPRLPQNYIVRNSKISGEFPKHFDEFQTNFIFLCFSLKRQMGQRRNLLTIFRSF